jgi:hypothetical protein
LKKNILDEIQVSMRKGAKKKQKKRSSCLKKNGQKCATTVQLRGGREGGREEEAFQSVVGQTFQIGVQTFQNISPQCSNISAQPIVKYQPMVKSAMVIHRLADQH